VIKKANLADVVVAPADPDGAGPGDGRGGLEVGAVQRGGAAAGQRD